MWSILTGKDDSLPHLKEGLVPSRKQQDVVLGAFLCSQIDSEDAAKRELSPRGHMLVPVEMG